MDGSSTEPHSNEAFQTQEYWDARYAREADGDFDWFKTYADIRDIVHELIPQRNARILMLGTGNSTLSADMFADGYSDITNIDFSGVLIERMRARQPETKWLEMDIRDLKTRADELGGAESWDVVLDKATLDALMATKPDESVWDPPAIVKENVAKEVDGVLHVLKPKGVFLYLTFGQPHFRRPLLQREAWQIETRTLGEQDMFPYYFYICRKQ
ncbi:S-adenosyl-L-methionine-dependent methyltransferase [Tilletiopsis washingtonensis]|uniref:S-adenosyl-L-methionine-dependent methyltransferase n=1 Tax=Tilletiopsis washingtonensis TaxID=58919 RepID=A0A316ZCQ5_9BASI|nr:S-adenosyl-L-methionine-dependent methyltransferase [Tilletiopsis washingtonensis]PWN98828.1 S-adenosyl-L-methionine-dependent methyltransferase [Tilletiopsis washingtonensis]